MYLCFFSQFLKLVNVGKWFENKAHVFLALGLCAVGQRGEHVIDIDIE